MRESLRRKTYIEIQLWQRTSVFLGFHYLLYILQRNTWHCFREKITTFVKIFVKRTELDLTCISTSPSVSRTEVDPSSISFGCLSFCSFSYKKWDKWKTKNSGGRGNIAKKFKKKIFSERILTKSGLDEASSGAEFLDICASIVCKQ